MDKNIKILVVEDSPDLMKAISMKLQTHGMKPILATNGEEALLMLRENPDVVWLDIYLPKINGYEFLKIVRGNKATTNLPVVVVTNSAGHQMRKELEQLGILDFFVKADSRLDEVIDRIQTHFDTAVKS
ncbi:hypothetical protein A2841_00900 [Candidatus Kaiserbacteria bacterium RIFCSPHIGHO2_01_FULL_48_10]|uniref:Response regulatory domain-containing protein n=1 Tax=Candidatus Kaiserbacteria bacterium RIFCSPHIGHO2_01_FULL_48_10 TaxID=1798476 RepID=A0A1F6C4X7_9BACT|nr:MAG: hypothetical protein A2841_00900 [Candidatus Kaiserbacteria bacterium RIFCSPHIGHO2_01_FULL_48_10]HLC99964.1 response regulator [Patescibacteria group bacterium]